MPQRSLVVILILGFAIGACSSNDADSEPSPETTVSSATSATSTTSAGPQVLMLSFDGDQCSYVGLSAVDRSEPLSLVLVNDSELTTIGSVYWVPPDAVDDVMATVGTDFPAATADPIPGATQAFFVEAAGGDEQSISNVALPSPGTYVLSCTTTDGATRLHIWRSAAIEVS